jgi:hypothetical protein
MSGTLHGMEESSRAVSTVSVIILIVN